MLNASACPAAAVGGGAAVAARDDDCRRDAVQLLPVVAVEAPDVRLPCKRARSCAASAPGQLPSRSMSMRFCKTGAVMGRYTAFKGQLCG